MELSDNEIDKHVKRMELPLDKPLITQVSRFDKWKDPVGVIDVFKRVKEKVDCRLVLCGSMASDDPEGYRIYDDVKKAGEELIDKGDLIILVNEKDLSVNALQQVSSVVVQKSIKEGFGLTATEALWKGTPVVSSNVGGLSIQIQDGINGHTTMPMDNQGFADRITKILRDKEHAAKIGRKGKETVRQKFLITRLLLDYLNLMIGDLDRSRNFLM
jgi:trehalose synthase